MKNLTGGRLSIGRSRIMTMDLPQYLTFQSSILSIAVNLQRSCHLWPHGR